MTVTRTGGSAGAQTFSYATADGTAKAGADYTARSGSLAWANGDAAAKTFTIPLINNNRWTSPTERSFTVSLAKTAGDATLGTSRLTVTITEATPYVPGLIGFTTASGSVREGTVYTGRVSRTAGAAGAASVTVAVTGGYAVAPTTLTWADGNSDVKTVAVSGIGATAAYDPRTLTLTLAVAGGTAALGQAAQTVSVLDQAVTQTFDAYTTGRPVYQNLTQEDPLWFYNQTVAALRTEPLNSGARAVLAWTAPQAGRLRFTWGHNDDGAARVVQEPGVAADVAAAGTFSIVAGGRTNALTGATATQTVGVRAGDVVRWIAQGSGGDYVAVLGGLVWDGLAPASAAGLSPADGTLLQIDAIRANQRLVNLVWQAGAGNPADKVQRLYAGASQTALANKGPAASGVNAVTLGIVNLAAAQGAVYWRVDTELPTTFGRAVAEGPVWNFSVIDLPSFRGDAPAAGSTVDAFLKAGAVFDAGADSATPVNYTAAGLPRGMAINPVTGEISGTATRAGSYTVTVTATNSEGASTLTFTILVQALPAYAIGRFQGVLIGNADGVLRGTLTFSATRTGRISARVEANGVKRSLRGTWLKGGDDGTFTARLEHRSGDLLDVTLTTDGVLTGVYNDLDLIARATTAAQAAPFVGYYTALLPPTVLETGSPEIDNRPEGNGFLTLNVTRTGRTRYSGYLADGTRLSGSAQVLVFSGTELQALGYNPESAAAQVAAFPIFKILYRRRGAVAGLCWILAGDTADAGDNEVWIDNSEWRYPGQSAALPGDAFRANFNGTPAGGGALSPTAQWIGGFYARPQDFTAAYNGAVFHAEGNALALAVAASTLRLPAGNALSASLLANGNSGLLSGWLTPAAAGARRTRFRGVLVPAMGVGGGFYLVGDPAVAGYRLKRSRAVIIEGDDR